MHTRLHVKYPLFLSNFNGISSSQQTLGKGLNIRFNQNPSSGSRVVPYGRTDTKKLTVAFRNFANAPKTHTISLLLRAGPGVSGWIFRIPVFTCLFGAPTWSISSDAKKQVKTVHRCAVRYSRTVPSTYKPPGFAHLTLDSTLIVGTHPKVPHDTHFAAYVTFVTQARIPYVSHFYDYQFNQQKLSDDTLLKTHYYSTDV